MKDDYLLPPAASYLLPPAASCLLPPASRLPLPVTKHSGLLHSITLVLMLAHEAIDMQNIMQP